MKFIKKYLFNRTLFLFIAILIQMLVLVGVTWRFYNYFLYFYGFNIIISIIAIIFILNNSMNLVYKLAWIIPILLFPIFGWAFYFLFGGKRLRKKYKRKMVSIDRETEELLDTPHSILNEIKLSSKTAANQSQYLQNYANYPPYYNTATEYFKNGKEKFKKLKEELKKAEKYIFLEYFIIAEGEMWDSILKILKNKVAEGVEVRVIYDDFGCLVSLPYKYNKKLEQLGIKTAVFNPLKPVLSSRHNNRDHRKIAVIDGHTAFTGGINLADEYINVKEKFGHWKDSAVMIKGKAVWSMTVMFLSMWNYLKGNQENLAKYKYDPEDLDSNNRNKEQGYIQPFADSPLDDEAVSEIVYLNMINKAEDYVYITTPYLVIDSKMITALTSAAKAGVDVRIITPYHPDKWYVHLVTRSYYEELVKNGVKIYEYSPGFIHSKNFMCDDKFGVVGSINMDYRSLYLHFECGVWMYDCDVVNDMKEDFLNTLNVSKKVTPNFYEKEYNGYKSWFGSVLRVLAPLM